MKIKPVMRREWAMPNAETFKIKPIRELVKKYIPIGLFNTDQIIIDPFARNSKYGTMTNDINPEFKTDFNMDALEFMKSLKDNFADFILYDPPYSFTQVKELYDGFGQDLFRPANICKMDYWAELKNEMARVLKVGGIILGFGWNSNGLGINRGCEILEVMLVAHGGSQNDTICVVERKIKNIVKTNNDMSNQTDFFSEVK